MKFSTRDPSVCMTSPEAVRHETLSEKSALNSTGRTEMLDPVSIKKFLGERCEEEGKEKDFEKTEIKKGWNIRCGGEK